jgi:hypothetical protein
MEAANTSETLVNFYRPTWCNNPEDSPSAFIVLFKPGETLGNPLAQYP